VLGRFDAHLSSVSTAGVNPLTRLGPELTAVLLMAMISGTLLAALGKMEVGALQPIFSAVITGAFALAMPNKPEAK
jgi:ABC-type transporter Mla maintaining outer membrane lipid asymmetry permease subunit MlaE